MFNYISMVNFAGRLLWLIAFVVLFAHQGLRAQDNPINKITISSPTAASLGKYGDIPVNYHTGIPQINIPLYTVTAGPLSLPVSLSYHASGLKVQEPAGWVGAAWALNAGGVITRSVMGAPDERGTNNGGTETNGHFSDYGYNNYAYDGSMQDWLNFSRGFKDGEPDLYFFNFGSYSGKFYFRDDRKPIIVPEQDIRIVPSYSETGNNSIQGFVITTPDGVQYSFGNLPGITGATPIEITKPVTESNGLSTANVISGWYLNKVASSDNLFIINLIYQAENYGFHTFSMFPIDPNATAGSQGLPFGATHGYELIKNIVQGVRLSQITFPNGVMNFIAGAARTDLSDNSPSLQVDAVNQEAKKLGSIEISDGITVLRKFNFLYDYFSDNSTALATDVQTFAPNLQTDRQRLKLTQLQEVAGNGSISKPPYYFTYFNEQVPRRLSFGFDHWGFVNGVNANQTPIPSYTQFASGSTNNFPGGDREAHWPAMRAGTLQQINYPTGGYSLLNFESNDSYITTTSIINATILNHSVHLYGQADYINSQAFTTDGTPMNMSFNNSANFSCAFSIKNSSNSVVYTNNIANNQAASNIALTLAAGTYTATLTLYSTTGVTGGTLATITQWQTVQTTNTVTVGGNRIKTITNNDGITTSNTVTNYSYLQDNGKSSAILYSRPVYVSIIRNDLIRDVGSYRAYGGGFVPSGSPNGCTSVLDAQYYKSAGSIRPMATSQGYHAGYSQIKVAQTGNGYSIYKYYGSTGVPVWQQNLGDVSVHIVNTTGCDGNALNYPAAPLPFDYMRGELQYEAHYTEAGQILKEASYTPVYAAEAATTPAFMVVAFGQKLLATRYELATSHKTQTQVTQTVYNPGGGSLTTTSTSYNESPYHHEVTRTSTTSSTAETIETKKKFAFDFRIAACDAIANGNVKYKTDCDACLSTYNTARTSCTDSATNTVCLTNAYLNYMLCLTNARKSYVTYQQTNFTNTANTFKTKHDAAKSAADPELKPVLELQDNFQNVPVETSSWRKNTLLSAAFSRYDYSANPAGKVYFNKVQSIGLVAGSATFTPAATNAANTSITKDSRYKDEGMAKFNDGNLSEATGKDGVTTSYIWGHNKTLPIVKAIGVDFATLSAAYTSVAGNPAQLRSHSSLYAAQISTYTYTPMIGMIGETDVNGKSISYEYDALQRLLRARDFNNNILKQYDYKYQVSPPNTIGQWVSTGNTRCKPCPANSSYISNILQREEKDNNTSSASYNTLRWTDIGISSSCVVNPSWQNTSTPVRCQKNSSATNTGDQEQEQTDVSPCSATYGQTQWVVIATNTTACPLAVVCVNCTLPEQKCISGRCKPGLTVYTGYYYDQLTDKCYQTYHYEWSDGSWSSNYTSVTNGMCPQNQ